MQISTSTIPLTLVEGSSLADDSATRIYASFTELGITPAVMTEEVAAPDAYAGRGGDARAVPRSSPRWCTSTRPWPKSCCPSQSGLRAPPTTAAPSLPCSGRTSTYGKFDLDMSTRLDLGALLGTMADPLEPHTVGEIEKDLGSRGTGMSVKTPWQACAATVRSARRQPGCGRER